MITVIHPSRGRPEEALTTMNNWLNRADGQINYILSIEFDQYSDYVVKRPDKWQSVWILPNNNKSAIEAINYAAKEPICTGLMVVISDDFDCPEHWDTLLLEAIGDRTDFCAKTIDGHQDWLITLPIMDRKYYERFGYVYNPEYGHMHADLDMTCTAWMLGRYIKLPLEFKHNHYSLTGQKPDEINKRNNGTWGQGKVLFNQRLERNFDLVGDLQPLPKLPKY